MSKKTHESLVDEFTTTYKKYIHRDEAEVFLQYLCRCSNFMFDPASTKYHLAYAGGLVEHSLNVFHRLEWLISNDPIGYVANCVKVPSMESVAIVALLHDVCKADTYELQEDGTYRKEDKFLFGHGEKSVYLINQWIDLTDEEAMAIRYHMGSWNEWEKQDASKVFQSNILAFLLHVADEYATFVDEGKIHENNED